jgi:hypothetical protein
MESRVIELNKENTAVEFISAKNNVIVTIKDCLGIGTLYNVAINKKYFNLIHQAGFVEGRIRQTNDGLWVFEGFNFR